MLEGTKLVLRKVLNQEENPCEHCRASLRNKWCEARFFSFYSLEYKTVIWSLFPEISLDIKKILQYKF
jgi:hypothetical protein